MPVYSSLEIPVPDVTQRSSHLMRIGVTSIAVGLLAFIVFLQQTLDRRIDGTAVRIEELAQLPRGEHLKPALLGYHHLGADILWLRLLQVWKKKNTDNEYEWIYSTHSM